MKEVLFATGNASKVARYKDKLLERGIVLKSLKDIDVDIDVDENGSTAIENATIKAKAYNEATDLPTMATDDTMYIVGIPEEKQPGIFVRRVNGKRLNDQEMIDYYTGLVKEYGKDGKLDTKWILGMVIIKDGKVYTHEETTSEYYILDTPAKDMREGYPLSSILFNKKANKYDIYLTEEDKKIGQADDKGFVDFIDEVINE
jgi:inosine/xanthosine triphosphate pyrophosphatase family protein